MYLFRFLRSNKDGTPTLGICPVVRTFLGRSVSDSHSTTEPKIGRKTTSATSVGLFVATSIQSGRTRTACATPKYRTERAVFGKLEHHCHVHRAVVRTPGNMSEAQCGRSIGLNNVYLSARS